MKLIKSLTTITLLSLLAVSCDVIDEPYMVDVNNSSTIASRDSSFQRIALLEEFTGHYCSNCPAAAAIAAQLHSLYGKRFLIIAYHSGIFARVDSDFTTDYTTPTSDELYAYFGNPNNPAGVINRINNGGFIVGSTDWGTVAAQQLGIAGDAAVGLVAEVSYNEDNRGISVAVDVKAQEAVSYPVWICAYITESGLISKQKTNDLTTYPDGTITKYEHKHVFRQALNGTWGSVIAETMSEGQVANKVITGTLNNISVAAGCELIVFAYNKTNGEILQAVALSLE